MKSVELKSVYGKTLAVRDHAGGSQVEIKVVDSYDSLIAGMLFSTEEIDKLREALELPKKEKEFVFYLVRQRKDNPLKLKIMFANTSSSKEFVCEQSAEEHRAAMTRNWGDTYNFFVLKKEA